MELFLLGWKNLFRNKRRTATSLVTVAFGAAGLLIYQGFNAGIMNQYRENTIHVRYGHGQIFPRGYRQKVLEKPWDAWIENEPALEVELQKIPDIKNIFPRINFYSFLSKGSINLAGQGEGVIPQRENKFFTSMNFESGHDIQSPTDLIVGVGLANSLGAKVGDRITLLSQTVNGQMNGADLNLAGIFHTGAKDFDDRFFRVDLSVAQNLLDTKKVEHIALETTGVEVWPHVAKEVAKIFPQLEAVSFDDLDAVYYKNAVAFLESQFQVIRTIILFIVGLGIFNTIAVGLLERAPEIGALRANGESRSRLFKILIIENAILGFCGGILGITVAIFLDKTLLARGIPMPPGPGITRQFITFIEIQPAHYVQALLLPLITAVVASIIPNMRLLRKTIPELLKSH